MLVFLETHEKVKEVIRRRHLLMMCNYELTCFQKVMTRLPNPESVMAGIALPMIQGDLLEEHIRSSQTTKSSLARGQIVLVGPRWSVDRRSWCSRAVGL